MLVFSFVLAGAARCRGQAPNEQDQKDQDVAEAARQERARKQSLQKKPKHVYTAQDLKREHILTPEDRAELEARKNQPAPPSAPSPQKPQDAAEASAVAEGANAASPSADSANVPLADVARRVRKQKQSQKLQRSAEFHLPFADAPALASPKPPAQPLLPPVLVHPPATVVKPAPPRVVAPLRPFVKRSPFERPRVLLPPAVVAPRRERTLAPLAPRVLPAPPVARAAPSIYGKLVVVTIKPGDSLWKFAASRLGDGHRWQELLALNPDVRDPNLIQAGTQLILPASVAPRPPVKYTVRNGDTLWTIAEIQLGHGALWACIAQANPNLRDANLIHKGQLLLLPASCPR